MAVPNIDELRSLLSQAKLRMMRSLWSGLERREERLEYLKRFISAQKMYSLTEEVRQRLDSLERRLCAAESKRRIALESRLEQAEGRLAAVGPLATLSRGYAIVRSPRGLVLNSEDVQQGEVLELILSKGRLLVRVVENRSGEEVYR